MSWDRAVSVSVDLILTLPRVETELTYTVPYRNRNSQE